LVACYIPAMLEVRGPILLTAGLKFTIHLSVGVHWLYIIIVQFFTLDLTLPPLILRDIIQRTKWQALHYYRAQFMQTYHITQGGHTFRSRDDATYAYCWIISEIYFAKLQFID